MLQSISIISVWSPVADMGAVLAFVENVIAKFSTVVTGSDFLNFVLNVVLFVEALSLVIAVVWPWFEEYFDYLVEHPRRVRAHYDTRQAEGGDPPVQYDTPVTMDQSDEQPGESGLVPYRGGQMQVNESEPYVYRNGVRYKRLEDGLYIRDTVEAEGHTVSSEYIGPAEPDEGLKG